MPKAPINSALPDKTILHDAPNTEDLTKALNASEVEVPSQGLPELERAHTDVLTAEEPEPDRIHEVFAELVEKSAKVSYEKTGVHTYDGETLVALRMSMSEFENMRSILMTLRTEYQLTK